MELTLISSLFLLSGIVFCYGQPELYQIGVGIADMTGPAAEINLMGYASFDQDSSGIHLRQYSRAFIMDDGNKRIVYVSADIGMTSQIQKLEVAKRLKEKFGDLYTEENICISSTHTHSGPAGYIQYFLYQLTSYGFIKQTLDAYVQATVESISMAHSNLQPGYIYWNKGQLTDASANRSPSSYLYNPPEERAKYKYNTDKSMFVLKLTDRNNKPIGMINWFAVHGTSMNNTNTLISSDNKGYASVLFEQAMNNGSLIGKGPFVAAFGQANEGDSSPNTKGAKCIDTGESCDFDTSTCNGDTKKCIAFGPGKDMFESTKIIAQKQFAKAKELFDSASSPISGPISYIHQYINMSGFPVKINDTYVVTTCKGSLGYSFAAGTTDGPGIDPFHQTTNTTIPIIKFITNLISEPSKEEIECQKPKAILLPIGEMMAPYKWSPSIVPTQILKIGNLAIAAVPGEFTTMSGRRTKDAVAQELFNKESGNVVIAGLSNIYTHYITTYEEYQAQRYEGGSTIFGPHSLEAYLQQFKFLAQSLASNITIPSGPTPPNLLLDQITFKPGVVLDAPPMFSHFGAVIKDVNKMYKAGSTVSVTFVSAHPRNDLRRGNSFLSVDKYDSNSNKWNTIATDSDWETKFHWFRPSKLEIAMSHATITWDIPKSASPGKYRIRHFGASKNILQHISQFMGISSAFQVVATSNN